MSKQTLKSIANKVIMAEILARSNGLQLIDSGAQQRDARGERRIASYPFSVCSLDSMLAVQVIFAGAKRGELLVGVRPPHVHGESRAGDVLAHVSEGRLVWDSRGQSITPGEWQLELYWAASAAPGPLVWAYQVWVRSSLRADLRIRQRTSTGAAVDFQASLSSPLAPKNVKCAANLRTPASSLLARVAGLLATSPALRGALVQQRAKHWPQDPGRPWWRLHPEHLQAALSEAKIANGAPRRPPVIPGDAVRISPAQDGSYKLRIEGQHLRSQGTHTIRTKLSGQLGADPKDRFERTLLRQVFATPEASPQHCVARSWSRKVDGKLQRGIDLSLWDGFGNPVLVGEDTDVDLGVAAHRLPRDDGKLSWTIDSEKGADLAPKLTIRGKKLAGSLELPLVEPNAGFDVVVREGPARIPKAAWKEALDSRTAGAPLALRAKEVLDVQPPPGKIVSYLSVFTETERAYVIERVGKGGKVDRIASGRGARRYPIKLLPDDFVRMRSEDDENSGADVEISGLRFE